MNASVLGIHHVTAIAGDPQRNLDFYAGLLGLRFVKRTVNYDDPTTYHFYFGDATGSPGSLLTFFPWPGARRGQMGAGQAGAIAFAVVPDALGYWIDRLAAWGLHVEGPVPRFDEQVLAFRDDDGLELEIVAHPRTASWPAWTAGPVPPAYAIRRLHGITLNQRSLEGTASMLTEVLGLQELGGDGSVRRFAAAGREPGALVDVRLLESGSLGSSGAGTVHHVAFRAADDAAHLAIRRQILDAGTPTTPVIDRNYFHSIYFREPGGVLFEVATDNPGFAIDEPVAHLGERLVLPPRYEPDRAELEAILPALTPPAVVAL